MKCFHKYLAVYFASHQHVRRSGKSLITEQIQKWICISRNTIYWTYPMRCDDRKLNLCLLPFLTRCQSKPSGTHGHTLTEPRNPLCEHVDTLHYWNEFNNNVKNRYELLSRTFSCSFYVAQIADLKNPPVISLNRQVLQDTVYPCTTLCELHTLQEFSLLLRRTPAVLVHWI